jgi:hypothetical protein
MGEEIKAQKCGRSVLIQTKGLNVNRCNNNIIVVFPMTSGRSGTNILG